VRDEAPLDAVAKRLDKAGDRGEGEGQGAGEVNLIVMLGAGAEVEVKLPGRYKVSPQIAGRHQGGARRRRGAGRVGGSTARRVD